MLKALITPGAYTAGNIPLTLQQNTNEKYALNADNSISIRTVGLTDVKANVVVEGGTATPLTITAYADGVAFATDSQTVASGSVYTFHINDVVHTIAQGAQWAKITLQFNGACTIVSGDVILTYER